jgi:hypothetical protein
MFGYSSTMNMALVCSSKMSAHFHQTIQHSIPEDSTDSRLGFLLPGFLLHFCMNFKMGVVHSSKSVGFCQATQCYIPDESFLQIPYNSTLKNVFHMFLVGYSRDTPRKKSSNIILRLGYGQAGSWRINTKFSTTFLFSLRFAKYVLRVYLVNVWIHNLIFELFQFSQHN